MNDCGEVNDKKEKIRGGTSFEQENTENNLMDLGKTRNGCLLKDINFLLLIFEWI